MPSAKLHEVRFEASRCTVYGEVDGQNRFDLHLCGHDMPSDDTRDAANIVSSLNERGNTSERPSSCAECSGACNMGCIIMQRTDLGQQVQGFMEVMTDVTSTFGEHVELTFTHADASYIFSARWNCIAGSLVVPTHYYLENTWTYFEKNPSEKLLAAIRDVPGVQRVETEALGTGSTALDIVVSSSAQYSLEECLAAVTDILAAQ